MEEWRSIILVIHLISTLFMAAPLYMLIIVNERVRFGLPPGDNTDRSIENIIKRQPIRGYTYLAAILVTGLLLLSITGSSQRNGSQIGLPFEGKGENIQVSTSFLYSLLRHQEHDGSLDLALFFFIFLIL